MFFNQLYEINFLLRFYEICIFVAHFVTYIITIYISHMNYLSHIM